MGREMGGVFRREGAWVSLWLIIVNVWQKTTKFCKAIILQLKKSINSKIKTRKLKEIITKDKKHKILSLMTVDFLCYSGYNKECIAAVLLPQDESESESHSVAFSSFAILRTVALQAPPSMAFFQARTLEWVVTSFSRGSSQPGDRTLIFCIACIIRRILYQWATWQFPALELKPQQNFFLPKNLGNPCFLWRRVPNIFLIKAWS